MGGVCQRQGHVPADNYEVLVVRVRGLVTQIVTTECDRTVHGISRVEYQDLVVDDGAAHGELLIKLKVTERPSDFPVGERRCTNHRDTRSLEHVWRGSRRLFPGLVILRSGFIAPHGLR